MVIPLYMVFCFSSVPANAPKQAVFCDHFKSSINFPPTLENLHCTLILSPRMFPTICVRVLDGLTSTLCVVPS